ncbi:MAG: lipoyl(octanoyl) transferase LipB [Syntrophobacter sp.]
MLDYKTAWDLQLGLVEARRSGIISSDILLLLEHSPVFTLGRRGGLQNLIVPEAFVRESGVPIMHVERGGDITYHGPGQLVGYPVLDLHSTKLTVTEYVEKLEEIMIRTAAHWGVLAERNARNRGIWVGNKKLGSLGIALRRGIAFHGFAFNVNLSLEPFSWINPCGLQGVRMTSLEFELSKPVNMREVRDRMKTEIRNVFQVELGTVELSGLRDLLAGPIHAGSLPQ